ncbi:preprotein translocase subunit YajC [Actinotignum urinale]|uniref:Preprotein translocase subunit YajC n=1 Tax=Actinotignum urinale TaxID=190146 RepID=A0AAW9HN93_9ACTO|nr:preprotein translocase subunit YajC [Actinotignum urinale]MDY5129489.1 preprotein translocase subunit YajC [Actinotignum urinale]MDY5132150.1 preprotein translocase subunit YajC [Actinotignum urinale]MDY5152251.1 preprotein translocase subunit YajC [Actinotignum urinale]MDY5155375.1 preprotein translocase subunit YajC [Actinotignum urinale]WIK59066.1 preprotein translocase subunit YajC [Actinotignum urinale]
MEYLIIFAVMAVIMIFMSQQSKKTRARMEQERESVIVPGTDVVTTSGFFGKIVSIDGDAVTLESPSGDETVWMRQAIRGAMEIPLAPITEEEAAQLDNNDVVDATETPDLGVEKTATFSSHDSDSKDVTDQDNSEDTDRNNSTWK